MEIKPLFVCLASVRANVINLSAPLSSSFFFLILNAKYASDFVCNDVCEPLIGQKKPCGFAPHNRSLHESYFMLNYVIKKTFHQRHFCNAALYIKYVCAYITTHVSKCQ